MYQVAYPSQNAVHVDAPQTLSHFVVARPAHVDTNGAAFSFLVFSSSSLHVRARIDSSAGAAQPVIS
jgi:hypothetical protein